MYPVRAEKNGLQVMRKNKYDRGRILHKLRRKDKKGGLLNGIF